ncbi:(deoxy)nucleoside triphosphate pyrophosphohydrolase [Lunatimonas lonarensis]|uniref:(deoxy)nucleoside triphosphate pyrophosphohydrolase n=1 Tax=Lunatimonas lonarensis TaxID=1232681 RepID=UPI0004BBCD58|nr:(deoxy)nucleoside triphosphate pyrophosphohydrolase [Lunatimonas lonarensis]
MIDVVCAVIIRSGRVLCAKRGVTKARANQWEFPGGKIDQGEKEEEALIREIFEELGVRIRIGTRLESLEHEYPDIAIRLIPFIASLESEDIVLAEHSDVYWAGFAELAALNFSEADRKVVAMLRTHPSTQGLVG